MIEKVCSGIFMSLHVRGLHFAISVHTRLGPCALCCGMSEQPARTCSIPQLTCGVPGELQQAGNTGKMTWAGRILANWVHSRILFLAAWCPLCGLCKILFRPSPGWSHLTSEPHPLGTLPFLLAVYPRHAILHACTRHCWLCRNYHFHLADCCRSLRPRSKVTSFLKPSLIFGCRADYSLPPCSFQLFLLLHLLNFSVHIESLPLPVLASRRQGPLLIKHCTWYAWCRT